MKTTASTLMALTLALILAVPVFAGGGQEDMVTKTFTLTLHGDVPADEGFIAGYVEEGQNPDTEGHFVVLCADLDRIPKEEREGIPSEDIISDQPCAGHGNVYSFERKFERGTGLAFFFARVSVTDEDFFEIFSTSLKGDLELDEDPGPEDFETLNSDTTNTAWFRFSGGGDDQQMPEMPSTGAGGMAGGSLPLGNVAAALALLAAGGYAVIRRC